jgi:hypothetical protein
MKQTTTTTALALIPEKVSKKIKPPLSRTQIIDALVETKVGQFHLRIDQLQKAEAGLRKIAEVALARAVVKLKPADFTINIDGDGNFSANFNASQVGEVAREAVAEFRLAEKSIRDYRVEQTGSSWNNTVPTELRQIFRKKIIASLQAKEGSGPERLQTLLKLPSVKLAFENMLASLEGDAVVESPC